MWHFCVISRDGRVDKNDLSLLVRLRDKEGVTRAAWLLRQGAPNYCHGDWIVAEEK